MPLVFAENEETESGISYEDRTGISYQYPRMYRRLIRPGERFVYYRGRKKRGGGRALQVYFGTGVVGSIQVDPRHKDRFVCDILDYWAFPTPVPFRDGAGGYLESGAARRGYFQRGVRVVSEEDFRRILAAAQAVSEAEPAPHEANADREGARQAAWPSPDAITQIEEFATRVAADELRRRYPQAVVDVLPRNNPGFDIVVREPGAPAPLCFEVKGTVRPAPQFFITEGELHFSQHNASRFGLIVVYAIDVGARSYKLFWHEGAISQDRFELRPVQWAGQARVAL